MSLNYGPSKLNLRVILLVKHVIMCGVISENSVAESHKTDGEVVRPKTLATLDRSDAEAVRSPGNGSVPVSDDRYYCVSTLCCVYYIVLIFTFYFSTWGRGFGDLSQ